MNHAELTVRIREAMILRSALLRLIVRGVLGEDDRQDLISAQPRTWRLVLTAECCALPVAERLRTAGYVTQLESDCRVEVEQAEIQELQRVMAARSVLRYLDEVAVRVGVRIAILKGGAVAADRSRSPVDVGDVDVLLPPAHTTAIWQALLSDGWQPRYEGPISLDEMIASDRFVPVVSPRVGLPVDLHLTFDDALHICLTNGQTVAPLTDYRALDRLTGPRAFTALLRHATITHPYRRGHLRDFVLLVGEVIRLDQGELQEVRSAIERDVQALELREVLEQICAFRDGVPPIASAQTLSLVVWKYLSVLQPRSSAGHFSREWSALSFMAIERGPARRARYRTLLRDAIHPPPEDTRVRAARYPGWIPRWTIGAGRFVFRLALVGSLAATGWLVRRRMRLFGGTH